MILGVLRESGDFADSSTPNRALLIKPEPCGSCGASLAGRTGLGDGAFDAGVAVPFSFLALGADCSFGCSLGSTSITSDGWGLGGVGCFKGSGCAWDCG
jgi:hypothetical protein